MEADRNRTVKDGSKYDALFPKATMLDTTVKRGAEVIDTVKFIPKAAWKTKWQTEKIAPLLKGKNTHDTCRNIWNFLYQHVRYFKDEEGREQIRSPRRLWADRFRGVDCDCFSTTICTLLLNCGVHPKHIRLRITKYKTDRFQHIYPIVLTGDGTYITIDCVVNQFNYEEPYTQKEDHKMDLEFLDGIDDAEMGKIKLKLPSKIKIAPKLKEGIKKVAHIANRANPITLALRNGLLAAMKLNFMKIAQRIKWGYLNEEQAKAKDIDLDKWRRLVTVREKLESVFYGAGGKQENLKKSILTGRGNKNHEVSGLFGYMPEQTIFEMNERTPLPQLIGYDVFHSENIEGMEGLGDLGEPVTAASITAATGALSAIAVLLKQVGNIFKKKQAGSEDFNEDTKEETIPPNTVVDIPSENSDTASTSNSKPNSVSDSTVITSSAQKESFSVANDGGKDEGKMSFWENNKKWLKPTLIGVGGLALLYFGYRAVSGHSQEEKQREKPLSGVKRRNTKKGKSDDKINPIDLS